MMKSPLIGCLLTVMICLSSVLSEECIKDTACSCHVASGKVDLSPITKKFSDLKSGDYLYSYSPCGGLSSCTSVDKPGTAAACQRLAADPEQSFNIGDMKSAVFTGEPETSGFILTYYHDSAETGTKRTSRVTLLCVKDEEASLTVNGEKPELFYNFELKSKYACIISNSRISTGSVLLIIFFVLLLVYIVGGMLFMRFVRGAQGIEMIPNREFWKELPLLVYDGCRFVVKGCKADSTYSQI